MTIKEEVIFDPETHTYWLGDTHLISVTQLLKKHGIGVNYNDIDPERLRVKAQRGTLIHGFLEVYIKSKEKPKFVVDEVEAFESFVHRARVQCMQSERVVHNDLIAGTLDLSGYINCVISDKYKAGSTGVPFIMDFKTNSSLDYDACRWQLSLYHYLDSDGTLQSYYDTVLLYIMHFAKDGDCRVIPFNPVPYSEIIELLERERYSRFKQEIAYRE